MIFQAPYLGMIPGEVIDNDPDDEEFKGLGAVMVIAPAVMGLEAIGPMLPLGTVGGGGTHDKKTKVPSPFGIFAVPPLGATVALWFLGGDIDQGYYLAANWGKPEGASSSEVPDPSSVGATKGDPRVVVWETDRWRVILAGASFDKFRIESKTTPASFMEIDGATGKISLETTDLELGGALATEAAVLGTAFTTLFNTHTHPVPLITAGLATATATPTTTPMIPGTHTSITVKVRP